MALQKLISGGQTGVDRAALDAALLVGFPCGGWCPAGRRAEDGIIAERYPLVELPAAGYRQRTVQNVLDSDGTLVIFFGQLQGGTEQTVLHCKRRQKRHLLIDATQVDPARGAELAANFVTADHLDVLNVAGPRQSGQPAAYSYAFDLISRLILAIRDGV